MSAFQHVLLPVIHVRQHHQSDCLTACAYMTLQYLGATPNYRRLLKVLQTNVEMGTPFSNITKLETMRITVVYQRGNLTQLYTFLQNGWPLLVPVETRELPYWFEDTSHAVVVVGMDNQVVYINDPAFPNAPVSVPHGDFDLAWLEHNEYYAVLAP